MPPKPKSTSRHLKQGIQDFHRKYILVPADKAANNVVVVWRLHYINTLKQELSGTKAYKETSEEEKSVVNGHCNHLALKFSVCVKERQDRLPTMYWLPKLHKTPYKARFTANSSSCTTTELSKLLTSCLTAVKNHVIRYCEKVYERSGKNLFWSIKNSGEVLNKLKSRGFRATSLSTYDFSTLYTTLTHNLIKEKLINLIEWTFKREGSPYIACNERQAYFVAGWLQGHWWGFISRNYVVWPTFFLMNVFIALKGSHFRFYIWLHCSWCCAVCGRKTSPRTSTIV